MNIARRLFRAAGIALLAGVLLPSPVPADPHILSLSGGPDGSRFQLLADAIRESTPAEPADYRIEAAPSTGSLANLRAVDSGDVQLALVYSGHLYLGHHGRLQGDPNRYANALAVAYLAGVPAQLLVRPDSGIASARDLAGRRLGIGAADSPAFANGALFLTHLGVWDKIERQALGSDEAAAAFGRGDLDALWLFTAFPSPAATRAAEAEDIALVNLRRDAIDSDFFDQYPYFTQIIIPAGTYQGADQDTPSFQDSAILVASAATPASIVYDLLARVFSEDGLALLHARGPAFGEIGIETGLKGVITPLHPGAERFWKEKGIL